MRLSILCSLAMVISCSDGSSRSETRDGAIADKADASRADASDRSDASDEPEAGSSDAAPNDRDDGSVTFGDAGADAARPPECADQSVTISPADRFVLIIDGSTSMEDLLGDSAISRWDTLRGALFGADGAVTTFEDPERIALAIFGSEPTCPLPLGLSAPRDGRVESLEAAFPLKPPGLATPTDSAIRAVAEVFAANARDTTLVLITDGDPNSCEIVFTMPSPPVTWPETQLAIRDAQDAGFAVRVVRVGSGIAYEEELQRAANIGAGLDPDAMPGAAVGQGMDADSLRAAVANALEPRSTCRLHADAALDPAHICEGELAFEGAELECATDDGWWLESPHRIVLTGAACASLEANPSAAITASLPCAAIDLPPGQCRTSNDCEPVVPLCDDEQCVECTSADDCVDGEACIDGDCASPCEPCTGDTKVCDEESGECVGCLVDAHCSGMGICDPETKTCTGCRNNADCLLSTLVCDRGTGSCRACERRDECNVGDECCEGACTPVGGDPSNCGGCGVTCTAEQGSCTNGACRCGAELPCVAPRFCASLVGMLGCY